MSEKYQFFQVFQVQTSEENKLSNSDMNNCDEEVINGPSVDDAR